MATLVLGRNDLPQTATPVAQPANRPGFWRRLGEALIESRRRAVEREFAAYFARHPELKRRVDDAAPAWKQAADALPF